MRFPLPSNLLHSYWKWSIEIVDLPINMVIFHSYVKLPERKSPWNPPFLTTHPHHPLSRPRAMLCRYRCSNLSQVPTPFAWSLRPANGAGKAVLWEFNEDLMGNSEYLYGKLEVWPCLTINKWTDSCGFHGIYRWISWTSFMGINGNIPCGYSNMGWKIPNPNWWRYYP